MLIQAYTWPGNARQLENEIKWLVASVRRTALGEEQLDLPTEQFETDGQEKELSFDGKTIDEVTSAIEQRMIESALKKYHWNKQKAAQDLGLSRQGLAKKMQRGGLRGD